MPKDRFIVEVDLSESEISPNGQATTDTPKITGELQVKARLEGLGGHPVPMMVRLDEENTNVLTHYNSVPETDEQTTLTTPVEPTPDAPAEDESVLPLDRFCEILESEAGVVYSPEDDEIVFTGEKSDKGHYVEAIQLLFEYGYFSMDQIPYQKPRAKKRYLFNTEPVQKSGKDMHRAAEPVPGVYISTGMHIGEKKRNLRHLIDEFVDTDQ
ncbi:hypothetical protein V5735_01595 (plasmid) [Haladaptatus sp. SPP-AMP-3]|uniref:hypothetical protein n=1 Tax=Haladaptatus sp. SPP-AMP-3 TaxID=3121295 RepID=UPI003C2FAC79